MIKSVLRFVFFCVAVLLVGQITVSGNTIGAHVQQHVSQALMWTGNWLRETKWVKSVGGDRVIAELMPKKSSSSAKPVEASVWKSEKKKTAKPAQEDISHEDRKKIRLLLE